jgi:hypothetical protein
MARLVNLMLGRAYSYDDLVKESAPYLSNPNPGGLAKAMSHFDGQKRTFLEFTRLNFKEHLKQIAQKPTKAEQRLELLKIRLDELSWNAVERAVKDAKYVESWDYFIDKDALWFQNYPKSEWRRHLTARFITAALIGTWLTMIGRSLYQIEPYIESALELFENYDTEIKTLNVSMFEFIFEKLSNHDEEEGIKVSKLHDQVIRPLIDEQYAILDRLGADIKANSINVDFYQTQFARIDEIKTVIARTISASAIPDSLPPTEPKPVTTGTDIFISYRRDDEPAVVGRLYDLLKRTFPHHAIFIDVNSIPPGDQFLNHIRSQVAKCDALLAIIGPHWLHPAEASPSRLFQENDLVRKEIESALVCKTAIFPVLLNDTPMPSASDIPRSIAGLCALNAIRLSSSNLDHDAKPLIRAIKGVIKHHLDKHLTVGEFEAYELGERVGKETFDRISRGIKASFDYLSERMMPRFIDEAAPAIVNKDRSKLQALIDAFGKEARLRKAELAVGTLEYICKDMPHLGISVNEQTDPLFVAVDEHIQREFNELFLGMMDTLGATVSKLIEEAGWSF